MITNHQYLVKYPIDPAASKLILGTIHPHDYKNFMMDFFYGNELSLWKILNKAFPTELKNPSELACVLKFLKSRKLTVSDTIVRCQRTSLTALDKDLVPLELNKEALMEQIANSTINEILCTSGFGKNNAFKIFYCDILGLNLTGIIRKDKEVMLPNAIFGREVKVKFIYSPSGRALAGIGNSLAYKKIKHLQSVTEFRVGLYRSALV